MYVFEMWAYKGGDFIGLRGVKYVCKDASAADANEEPDHTEGKWFPFDWD